MQQLLEKKQGTRAIVFALLLTMMAWLAPANVGIAKAADNQSFNTAQSKTFKVSKKGKKLLKDYQKKNFYKVNKDLNGVAVYFKKASGNKIKFDIVDGYVPVPGEGGRWNGKTITGTLKGNKLKFKNAQFYCAAEVKEGEPLTDVKMAKLSGTITLVSKKTIKLKITSGRDYTKYYEAEKKYSRLKPGKTTTLKHDRNIEEQVTY